MAVNSFKIKREDDQVLVKVDKNEGQARGIALDQKFQHLFSEVEKVELVDQVTFDISDLPGVNADLVSKLVLFHSKISVRGIELKLIAEENMRAAFDFMLLDKIIEIDYL